MTGNRYTITIFTPTYNRSYILGKLYESLLRQTNDNFYWLIVDDGSTDDTRDVVNKWMLDGKIKIQYFKIKNSGKAAAMNFALDVAEGELFFCVDSDDYLSDDAVKKVVDCYKYLDSSFIGILAGKKNYRTNEVITKFQGMRNTGKLKELYDMVEISGDTALIHKTEIISKYRFPIFENEKFVPEAYLWDLLDQEGELYLLKEYVYMADYLKDGYTKSMKETIFYNSNGYYAYISQRLRFDEKNKSIFFDNVRCVSINIVRKNKNILEGTQKKWFNFIVVMLAYIYYFKVFYHFNKV